MNTFDRDKRNGKRDRAKGKNAAEKKNVPRNNDATFDGDSKLSIRRRMQRDYAPLFRICRITDLSRSSIPPLALRTTMAAFAVALLAESGKKFVTPGKNSY